MVSVVVTSSRLKVRCDGVDASSSARSHDFDLIGICDKMDRNFLWGAMSRRFTVTDDSRLQQDLSMSEWDGVPEDLFPMSWFPASSDPS